MGKRRQNRNEDESLWLTNVEFYGRAEKAFVRAQLNNVAEKVAAFRRQKKISQEKLAELACVSVSTIKFIEQKKRVPSLVVLLKIIYVVDRDSHLWK
jgi:DNA-binding XRE family transcriptional regulator